jgi:hypothetical protein
MRITVSDASGLSRFTSFDIDIADNRFIRDFQNVLGDGKQKRFVVSGYELVSIYDQLLAVAIQDDELINQQPYKAIDRETQAVTPGGGELVTLTWDGGSCDDRAETGILLLAFSDPGGRLRQTCTVTFYPCEYLKTNALSGSALWLPSPPS